MPPNTPALDDVGAELADLFPEFSCPRAGGAAVLDAAVPMIAREYATGLIGAYLGQQFEKISQCSDGILEYLGQWVTDPQRSVVEGQLPFLGWDYSFGDAYRSIMNGGHDAALVAASVAAHLGTCGIPGSWSIRLGQPVRLRWSGVLLPPATSVEVHCRRDKASIIFSGGPRAGTEELCRVDGAWLATNADSRAPVSKHGIEFQLLTRAALAMRDYDDLLDRALPDVPPEMYQVFDEALDILARYAPQYLPWIARTIHQMFLLRPSRGKVESGSVEHYLGLVHLSLHSEPLPVAELLVHEATHQYMNVIAKVEPLDDGTDSKTYWSPAVNTQRPVAKIIAALHAFGNVMLFYRSCVENGMGNVSECERQEGLLREWMYHLVPPVIDNPSLSRTGNSLCQPLLDALRLR
ncbi:hypothetical protein CKJ65_25160 [Mycobacterium intracellulare]|uniref:aKG-HExxH-type peptide beta-hydroxylase n=1 Tax=Mycobacterium intracellulare TaxID=1767 RepID=UPI000BAE75D2|nr:HEXXH motif-containing putative peptide modification protein [Mycobacterium intracellulare]PBA29001.1 hypothetical protein CKJ65_25160 [Mycobacterium intracellulare]